MLSIKINFGLETQVVALRLQSPEATLSLVLVKYFKNEIDKNWIQNSISILTVVFPYYIDQHDPMKL